MTKPNQQSPKQRTIENAIEVSGTPEEVWQAIATGPGITSWFMPAEVEEREGGTVAFDMGTGMAASGVVRVWDPPRRIAYEEQWTDYGGSAIGTLASEFAVEARAGGTCVVRLVSNLFTSSGDWDKELDDLHKGWNTYFENLRLYRANFPGLQCSTILVTGHAAGSKLEGYAALFDALGFPTANPRAGQALITGRDVPRLAGAVERSGPREVLLLLSEPARGTALIFTYQLGEKAVVNVHAYLYGDGASAVAAREAPRWEEWMQRRFPRS
jgi:uncharacterized protein YndB with AHSA1/START domain